jgi:sugar lactone lactonase YvrE
MFDEIVRLASYRRAFILLSLGAGVFIAAGCSGGTGSPGSPAAGAAAATQTRLQSFGASSPMVHASTAPHLTSTELRPHGWLSPGGRSGQHLVYGAAGDEVVIFQDGKAPLQVGAISSGVNGAYGLFVDAQGRLFVVNRSNATVSEYEPGTTTPETTYKQQLNSPLYATEDAAGDLYVSNSGSPTIAVYMNGSTSATTLPSLGSETDGMSFDASGSLYAAYRNGNAGGIEVFAAGATTPTDLGISLNQPQGLAIDPAGNLLVVETGGTDRVDVFAPNEVSASQRIKIPQTPTELALKPRDESFLISTLANEIYKVKPAVPNPTPKVIISSGLSGLQGTAVYPAFQDPGTYLRHRP